MRYGIDGSTGKPRLLVLLAFPTMLLGVAGTLKLTTAGSSPASAGLGLGEIVLAAFVGLRTTRYPAIFLALLLFATFLGVSANGVLDSHYSCGCFGSVRTPPQLTLAASLVGMLCLAAFVGANHHFGRSALPVAAGLCCGVAVILAPNLRQALRPATAGREEFLANLARLGDSTAFAERLIVLLDPSCETCEQVRKQIDLSFDSDPGGRRFAGSRELNLFHVAPARSGHEGRLCVPLFRVSIRGESMAVSLPPDSVLPLAAHVTDAGVVAVAEGTEVLPFLTSVAPNSVPITSGEFQ